MQDAEHLCNGIVYAFIYFGALAALAYGAFATFSEGGDLIIIGVVCVLIFLMFFLWGICLVKQACCGPPQTERRETVYGLPDIVSAQGYE